MVPSAAFTELMVMDSGRAPMALEMSCERAIAWCVRWTLVHHSGGNTMATNLAELVIEFIPLQDLRVLVEQGHVHTTQVAACSEGVLGLDGGCSGVVCVIAPQHSKCRWSGWRLQHT